MNTTATTPEAYIESLSEPRRSEIATLDAAIQKALPHVKREMGYGIGYGPYHYIYDSGREGDTHFIVLASQKNYISLYALATKNGEYIAGTYQDRLPKASIGKSCVRFRKLSDIDLDAIVALCKETVDIMQPK